MKKLFLTLALIIGALTTMSAQTEITPEFQTEMNKFLTLSNIKANLISTTADSWKALNMPFSNPTEVATAVFDDLWPDLVKDYTDEYAKYFTVQDMKNINNFYETETGKKLAMYQSDMAANVMKTFQTKYTTRMQNILMKYMNK